MKQNESVKKLEVGKDYVNVHNSKFIVIDRAGDFDNKGFYYDLYKKDSPCTNFGNWREATEEEVIEAFRKHLIHRYGKDWETMKIKERHPSLSSSRMINDGLWEVEISKYRSGWYVWNKNGLLFCNGIWVERLEEKKSTNWTPFPEDIKEIKAGKRVDNRYALKREVLTILSVESKLNPDKKISEYLEQFKLILEVL